MLGVAGLSLAALLASAALTIELPPLISPPLAAGPTNLDHTPLNSVPNFNLGAKPDSSQPLKPGVYRIHPYAIMLVVPETGLDDCCVVGGTSGNSNMPVVKPGLRAVPKTLSK
jgi:hypothetical protein